MNQPDRMIPAMIAHSTIDTAVVHSAFFLRW
ncbi:hypothetical protein NAS141_13671 [Sulfitobacter sp. NAS-14.1]|nr:hypothetical protein NAS141_13671 [Sulfitobacter sp. NAS-14.1]